MAITPPPTLTTPPANPPTRADPATFAARGDAMMTYMVDGLHPDMLAVTGWMEDAANTVESQTNAVLGNAANINTVSTNIASVNTAAANMAAIIAAPALATAAAASYDSFDDRYLGAKAAAPTLDNDGAALLTGALYWDTVLASFRVWSGSAWSNTVVEVDDRILVDQQLLGGIEYATDIVGQLAQELVGLPAGVEAIANFAAEVMDLVGATARQASSSAQIVPAPANASARGSPGEWAWDSGFIYVCTALNTWKRVAIATW